LRTSQRPAKLVFAVFTGKFTYTTDASAKGPMIILPRRKIVAGNASPHELVELNLVDSVER
jgi:hypothetical protein